MIVADGRPDRRLEPHRPGLRPSRSTSGAGRRPPARRREPVRLRRERLGRARTSARRARTSSTGSRRGRPRCQAANGDAPVPVDLVTTSARASTRTSARQPPSTRSPASPRRASMTEDDVRAAVARHTEQPLLGFLGEPRVNVLRSTSTSTAACNDATDPERDALDVRPTGGGDARAHPREDGAGAARPAARLPGHGAGRRQDLPDARGGPPPARARHGRRRRLRRGPRAAAHASSCSTASRSCRAGAIEYRGVVVEEMDTDAIIARRPDGRADRRARPHERPGLRPREALAGRRGHPRRRHPRRQHAQRPAPRERRRRGRDDHRRAGQRAPARRRPARAPTRSSSST